MPRSKLKLSPDSHDRAILRILQTDAKMPQRSIAEQVNLSPAAVQRRIAAMEAAGIIEKTVAIVATRPLDLTITAIVEVQLVDERPYSVEGAKAAFLATPEVQQCYYVTGGVSFVLVIVTKDMVAYEALTRQIFTNNPAVSSFRSLLALDRVKSGPLVVIP